MTGLKNKPFEPFTKEERVLLTLGYEVCIKMMSNISFTEALANFNNVAKEIGLTKLQKTNVKLRQWSEL